MADEEKLVDYLRWSPSPANPLAQNGRSTIRHAYAYGQSQSGRFLREFLYLGFNADRAGRKVFDGLLVHIGGARFTSTNMRFGLPARAPTHPQDPGAIADRFPFTYAETTDPFTGKRDGLLRRCTQSRTCPKLIFPLTRLSINRPAILTVWPVCASGAKSGNCCLIAPTVVSRSNEVE